jgi:hypothetical protein
MAVTPLPFLDRTAATFKTDVDAFFAQKLPQFSVEVNQVASAADSSASAANTSKNAAAGSATSAATSATNAANSATAANTSKTNAATSETNAAGSATAANTSKNAAAGSATAAATSATNAANSATRAENAAASISNGPVTSVNGKTGVVSLVKADLGLSLADNVSVKALGIGWSPLMPDTPDIDSVLLGNGWYSFGPNTAGTKPAGEDRGVIVVAGRAFQADSRGYQMWFSEAVTRVYTRRNIAGEWTPWVPITRPAFSASQKRLPLVVSDAGSAEMWGNVLSVPTYLDRSITAGAAAAQALDVSLYSIFDYGLTVNTTLSFTNLPSLVGETITIVVRIRQNASPKTITWPGNITWLTAGGLTPPTPGASQVIEYVLSTVGGGANWYGRVGAAT